MSYKVIAGVAGIAAFVAYCFSRGQAAHVAKLEVKEDLRRWEGEGGNVPAVATPAPTPAPASSVPPSMSQLRH